MIAYGGRARTAFITAAGYTLFWLVTLTTSLIADGEYDYEPGEVTP